LFQALEVLIHGYKGGGQAKGVVAGMGMRQGGF
jgi:hypothetical protein